MDSRGAEREDRLNDILLAYVEAAERGRAPDRAQLVRDHPEFAAELADFFAGRDRLDQLTEPLVQRLGRSPARVGGDATENGAHHPAAMPIAAGARLGDFRLIREVGRGGMGVVYEAEQLSLRRRVALKVLPFAAAADPRELQRFRNEALAAARLHHPHIVPVYAVGSEHAVHFYAMQFIDGQSLAELIAGLQRPGDRPNDPDRTEVGSSPGTADGGPAGATHPEAATAGAAEQPCRGREHFRRAAALVKQAAEALEYAHRLGVVHRDVKPGNLLLDPAGNVWVADFGLASFRSAPQITRTGEVIGTLLYTSPEQARAQRGLADHRTDVYSLGVTLYELLTLRRLFPTRDWRELVHQVLFEEPRPPRDHDRSVPVDLETVVLKAIAKDPASRYGSAQELADDLQRFLDGRPVAARRPGVGERLARWVRRHRAAAVASVALLSAAVVGLAVSTALIAAAHAEAKHAYERERQKAAEAEASFRQTRRVVDLLVELGDGAPLEGPGDRQVRKRLLEAAVSYYNEFTQQRRDDPSLRDELMASRARLERLLNELRAYYDLANFHLLAEPAVRDDLGLSPGQVQRLSALLAGLPAQPPPGGRRGDPAPTPRRWAELADDARRSVGQILEPWQSLRLRQIILQQPGPHVFNSPEVLQGLGLTDAQKATVSRIQTEAESRTYVPRGAGRPRGWPTELWKSAVAKMVALFTPEQKERWAEMVGEPFTGHVHFPPGRPPPPPEGGKRGPPPP